MKSLSPKEKETKFNQSLVDQYFKYGSVDEVFRRNRYSLPISYAGFQRLLDRYGVEKTAGPNSKLTEALEFLSHFAEENIPFDELYKKMPPSFKTSTQTLYRILGYVKQGITRRVGTALVITPFNNDKKILIGKDISTPKVELGKPFGALSIPMGYSRKRDTKSKKIRRVLQQEAFTKKVVKREFPEGIVKENKTAFMYLDIADVRVSVYHLQLPKEFSRKSSFSSYKLTDFSFIEADRLIKDQSLKKNLRSGITEIAKGYKKYLTLLKRNLSVNPLQAKSILNRELALVELDIE